MKTLVERLQGIYKRITGEEDPHIKYRIDSPDNIDAIVNDIENADIGGGSTELRHIVINAFQQEDDFEPQTAEIISYNTIAHYDANGVYQLGNLIFGEGVHSIDAYYPTIDNTNIIKFGIVTDPNQTFLVEAPEGVTVEESAGQYEETVYTLTISEDISEPIKITLKNEGL